MTRLKWLRLKCGIKQKELADLCEISQSALSRLETGKSELIDLEVALRMCRALKTGLKDLSPELERFCRASGEWDPTLTEREAEGGERE